MITADQHPRLVPAVHAMLGQLRRRIRQYVWIEGMADCLAWLGAAFWASLGIDWFFEPPIAVRVMVFCAVVIMFLGIFIRQIVRRAFARLTDGNMATVLERHFPELNDSLLTAVALCESRTEQIYNQEMLSRVCLEASERILTVRIDRVFNPRPLRNSIAAGVLMIFSLSTFGIIFPNAFATWTRRSLAFSDELWPRFTRLEIDGFSGSVRKVARGSDVDIVVRADTSMPRIPKVVEIRYREEGGVRGRATMNRIGVADPSKDRFQEFLYTRRNVLSPIRFDVYGGDDCITGQTIEVVDNPSVTLTLDCEFPAYMNRQPRSFPVTGTMSLPQGSKITIRAAANKDLLRVQFDTAFDDNVAPAVVTIEGNDLWPDRRGFNYLLKSLDKDMILLLTLFDADGIKSHEPVRLSLAAVMDQPPQVTASLEGIGTAITPQARVPVAGNVTDDYGVGKAWFEYALDQNKPQISTINTPGGHPMEFKMTAAETALDVRNLKLKPGQKLFVVVKAADLCDLGQGPNIGGGENWLLDIVTPDQLQIMLKARELVLRQRFEVIIQETAETRDLLVRMNISDAPSADNSKTAKSGSEPGDEAGEERSSDSPERRLALHLLRVQRMLTNCRKSAQETAGLAEAFDDICMQLVNNRIDTEELKQRLKSGIADPLRIIAEEMYPVLERRLDALLSGIEDPQLGPQARDKAKIQTDAVLLSMRRVLDRMIELQDYNEMVDMLRDIIKMQEQIHEQTEQLHKQTIRDLKE